MDSPYSSPLAPLFEKKLVSDLNEKLKPVILINDKFNQALKIRRKVSEQRKKFSKNLETDFLNGKLNREAATGLQFCNRNELRFLKVIESSKDETIDQLQKAIECLEEISDTEEAKILFKKLFEDKPREIKKRFFAYIQVIQEFYSSLPLLRTRLEAERIFLEQTTLNSFNTYKSILEKELKLEEELISKINQTTFLKTRNKILFSNLNLAVASLIMIPSAQEITNLLIKFGFSEKSSSTILQLFPGLLIALNIGSMILALSNLVLTSYNLANMEKAFKKYKQKS